MCLSRVLSLPLGYLESTKYGYQFTLVEKDLSWAALPVKTLFHFISSFSSPSLLRDILVLRSGSTDKNEAQSLQETPQQWHQAIHIPCA